MTMVDPFATQARDMLHKSEQFVRCTEIAKAYAQETLDVPGADDHRILVAAANLETAARNLRQLCTSVHAMRQHAETAQSIPVLTVGY